MKNIALVAIGLTAIVLSACAPSYYDRYDRYDRYGYYSAPRSYDRDRDGVPNWADSRPSNPYRY